MHCLLRGIDGIDTVVSSSAGVGTIVSASLLLLFVALEKGRPIFTSLPNRSERSLLLLLFLLEALVRGGGGGGGHVLVYLGVDLSLDTNTGDEGVPVDEAPEATSCLIDPSMLRENETDGVPLPPEKDIARRTGWCLIVIAIALAEEATAASTDARRLNFLLR